MTGRFSIDEQSTGYVPFIQRDACILAEHYKIARKGSCYLESKVLVGTRFPKSLKGEQKPLSEDVMGKRDRDPCGLRRSTNGRHVEISYFRGL